MKTCGMSTISNDPAVTPETAEVNEEWRFSAPLAAVALAEKALRYAQTDGGVRVEDYLAVLASMVGEAALAASGVIDINAHEFPPGAGLYADPINVVLSGDATELDDVPADSVLGIFAEELLPNLVDPEAIGTIASLYEHVAAHQGSVPWGHAAIRVTEEHAPFVMPIQAAFEMREAVDEVCRTHGVPLAKRHVPCTLALCMGIHQVGASFDLDVAAVLSLDIVFTMAKMAPMTAQALETAMANNAENSVPEGDVVEQ